MKKEGKGEFKIEIMGVDSGVNIYTTKKDYDPVHPGLQLEPVPHLPCGFEIRNLLSDNECAQFIKITECMGFDPARITTLSGMELDTDVRNNKRVIWHTTPDVWQPIWERIMDLVPKTLKVIGSTWEAHGLNERLRFYRYNKGEEFKPHWDGDYTRNSNDRSFLTFIIYLSDQFEGGCTTFFGASTNGADIKVVPKQGTALLFFHGRHPQSPMHEGSLVSGGTKYVLRSDVMYSRK